LLRLAGRLGDGAVINWLSAEDVKRIVPEVGDGKEVVCRIYVCPSEDAATVRSSAKMLIAAYLNVEVYARFQEWLGRGPKLQGMWEAWKSGDRKAAVEAIGDDRRRRARRPREPATVQGPHPGIRGQRGHRPGSSCPSRSGLKTMDAVAPPRPQLKI